MKKKLANLLRRWASKLSPEHTAPDLAAVIDMDNRRQLLNDIALAMYQNGAIAFHTEPEACPDSHDVLIATCRAVVVKR